MSILLEDGEINAWTPAVRAAASEHHAKTLPHHLEAIGTYENSKYENAKTTNNTETQKDQKIRLHGEELQEK